MKKTISCLISALLVIASVLGTFTATAVKDGITYSCTGTVDFTNEANLLNSWAQWGGKKPTVENNELAFTEMLNGSNPEEKRAVLPIKLESNTEYTYSIRYRVDKEIEADSSKTTFLQLYGCKNDASCTTGSLLATLLNWVQANNTDYSEFSGKFATGDLGESNLFGIVMKSTSGQVFYIDSVTIKKICSEGTIEFENGADIYNAWSLKSKPEIENGKLKIVSELGDNGYWSEKRVTLPLKLEKNKEYSYTIKYRVDKAPIDTGLTRISIYTCDSGVYSGYGTKRNAVARPIYDSAVFNSEYAELKGTFKTVNSTVDDTYNFFGLSFMSTTEQTFYIDSITVKCIDSLKGDLNTDGEINSTDLAILRKVLLDVSGLTYDKSEADVNKDGEIDIRDLVALNSSIS